MAAGEGVARLSVAAASGLVAIAVVVFGAGIWVGTWDSGLKGSKTQLDQVVIDNKAAVAEAEKRLAEKINDKATALDGRLSKVELAVGKNQEATTELKGEVTALRVFLQGPEPRRRAEIGREREVR